MNTLLFVIGILMLVFIIILVLLLLTREKVLIKTQDFTEPYSKQEDELLFMEAQYAKEAADYYTNPEKFQKC